MYMLCQYKHSLGVPGQGIHSTRIFGFAFWDIFFTIIVGYYFGGIKGVILLFLLGTFLHWLFCVETAFMVLV